MNRFTLDSAAKRIQRPIHSSVRTLSRWLLALALMLTTLGLPPQPPVVAQSEAHMVSSRGGGGHNAIVVLLETQVPVTTDDAIELHLTVTPLADAPRLEVRWDLPEGGTWLDGTDNEVIENAAANQPVIRSRRLQLQGEGVHRVQVRASYAPDPASRYAAGATLYFMIQADGSLVVSNSETIPSRTPISRKSTIAKEDRVTANQANGDPCFDVNGTLDRTDIVYSVDAGGNVISTQRQVPVRNAVVEVREEDTMSDDSYGNTVTDGAGHFAKSFCDDDGFLDDELELYVRVCAELRANDHLVARVEDLDHELYCYDTPVQNSGGGAVNFNVTFPNRSLNRELMDMAAAFNMADAMFDAWNYWNARGGPFFDPPTTVRWERAKSPVAGDDSSFYNEERQTIYIQGDTSPDEWDDSVLIHEWGHFAEDIYSCDNQFSGDHTLFGSPETPNLAWGEGYPDFYQSAVRSWRGDPNASSYIDFNLRSNTGWYVDFELAHRRGMPTTSDEGYVAGMLWDLIDSTNASDFVKAGDPIADNVTVGYDVIQSVYTSNSFKDETDGSGTRCTAAAFLRSWRKLGLPTTKAVAATVTLNTGLADPFNSLAALSAAGQAQGIGPANALGNQTVVAAAPRPDRSYRWWNQFNMLVDTSASMAQPAGNTTRLGVVRNLIKEQINDLNQDPKGTEFNLYTFDNTAARINPISQGQFYGMPQRIDGLNPGAAADPGCTQNTLKLMADAGRGKFNSELWLYTDSEDDGYMDPTVLRRQLNKGRIRGSVVLLAGCTTAPNPPAKTGALERSFLTLARGQQPSGLVPYLLTAIGSGGQFLYVAPNQLADAAAILRAQLSHSAGAGQWSDYVSIYPTYRWDRLPSWEYRWIDASPAAGGRDHGVTQNGSLAIFWNLFDMRIVQSNGQILFRNRDGLQGQWQTTLALNVLAGNQPWYQLVGPNEFRSWAECAGNCTHVYSKTEGDWLAMTSAGVGLPGQTASQQGLPRTYQALINNRTGEVRYQYKDLVGGDSGRSVISIDNQIRPVVVANQDISGAAPGMGYKFIPAPPQPSKVYEVDVDPLMEGVGFLQMGYSGSFAPMRVQRPDGGDVSCSDPAVLCLSLNNGLVQYVQVDTNGQGGVYKATIAAGATGEGTFSFNALAASELQVESDDDHDLSLSPHAFKVRLGRSADNNTLTAWFQGMTGARLGDLFQLYDDGAHDDGEAGDGLFGSEALTPERGAGYLWVQGAVDGIAFKRSDPVPFNFQPLKLTPPSERSNYGGATQVRFAAENQDTVRHCYTPDGDISQGWLVSLEGDFVTCIDPGATEYIYLKVSEDGAPMPKGSIAEVTLTLIEQEEGSISASAQATVHRYGQVTGGVFINPYAASGIRPGETVTLQVAVVDSDGALVTAPQAYVYLDPPQATLGTATLPQANFVDGLLPVVFTAGATPGLAEIDFIFDGPVHVRTTVPILEPRADSIELSASPADLRQAGQAQLLATVRNAWGEPLSGQTVRLNLSDDDGERGTIDGVESLTSATDANGQVSATFIKAANAIGQVVVTAEVLVPDEHGTHASHSALVVLTLSDEVAAGNAVFMPSLQRSGAGPAPDLVVYDDALAAGWQNWSWDSAINLANATPVKTGARSISVKYNSAWAGLSLRSPAPVSTAGYQAISFWVYGAAGGNRLSLYTQPSDSGAASPFYTFTAPAAAWTQFTVPLGALGNPSAIQRLNLQDATGAAQAVFYLDDLRLLK